MIDGGSKMNASTKNNGKKDEEQIQAMMTELHKQADAAGEHLLVHMGKMSDGILKPVIKKMLKHEIAHRGGCPKDCQLLPSLERLKREYGIND